MDFAFSTEQEDFRQTVRRFVTDRSPLTTVREAIATEAGYDANLWSDMARQLGLPGLLIPGECGGSEATMVEAALVMEELGRGLVPSPYFATVALGVVPMLVAGTDEQKKDLFPDICEGNRTVTTAINGLGDGGRFDRTTLRAVGDRNNVVLSGTKTHVIDGHTADTIIAVASCAADDSSLGLYLVDGSAPGLTRKRIETLDLTRPMATLEFDRVPAARLGETADSAILSHILNVVNALLAAEMVGGMEAAMTMAVDYAKVRHQFNRPIGSFQAIKHRCAEMAVEVDIARAAALYAAYVASEDSDELATAAPIAMATAAAGFDFVASWNIQIHGGIGFTWEHDSHLYYRRAKACQALFGSVRAHWLQLADRVGI
ncbi:MAG: acyl-CoA dehydrogenase family protein [Mycobacterium sp.]